MALNPSHHPSSSRRRYFGLSAIIHHVQEARKMRESTTTTTTNSTEFTNSASTETSPLLNLSDMSLALDTTQDKSTKEVHFNNKVTIVEIPAPEQPKATRVSFSDEVIDIDTVNSRSPSPTRKQVRFSCLKKNGSFKHTPIYKIKTFGAITPLLKPKKRVRFGCLKFEETPAPAMLHKDQGLVAEEAATFKRGLGMEMALI